MFDPLTIEIDNNENSSGSLGKFKSQRACWVIYIKMTV